MDENLTEMPSSKERKDTSQRQMTSNRTVETSPTPGNTAGGLKRSPTMREANAAASLLNPSQMMVMS